MRISFLLIVFGDTAGSMFLYKFMDKLCERGHDVYAVTPTERVRWKPGYSKVLMERFKPSNGRPKNLRQLAGKIVNPVRRAAREFISRRRSPLENTASYLSWAVGGLLRHWVPSDITVSTFCATSYANYLLMDKTVPVYYMQHYEEVFMEGEESVKMARMTYFLPVVLVANCTWLQNQIQRRFGRDSYLLYPGIDTEVFYPRQDIRKKYDHPSKITVASYYSPVKFKAWGDAVEAMKIVFQKAPRDTVEWVVFGSIPDPKPNLPVRFAGKVYHESLAELYSKAHVSFVSSWYESFGLIPLESMACGTAVVTTRLGMEDYCFDGENALVVPPGRPDLLAQGILKLIENPALARQLALAGERTARRFTWDEAANHLEKILREAPQHAASIKFADMPDFLNGRGL